VVFHFATSIFLPVSSFAEVLNDHEVFNTLYGPKIAFVFGSKYILWNLFPKIIETHIIGQFLMPLFIHLFFDCYAMASQRNKVGKTSLVFGKMYHKKS